jgi:general secretion pathway protein B
VSYILEALKKLEQKRQQEGIPNLLTFQGDATKVRQKRSLWPYITLGVVLLNGIMVLLFFWIAPWKHAGQPLPSQPKVARESIAPQPATTPPEKKEEQIAETKKDVPPPQKKDLAQPGPGQPPVATPGKVVVEATQPKTAPVQPPTPIKTSPEPSPREIKPVKPSNKVLSIKELSATIKGSLPELKMTVHSYNEQPQSRFVVINNNTIREGQPINADLKIEQITPNGVILNYQGHRFVLGINETP